MSLSPDRRLQLRIAGALALVVVVNALVLAVIAWSAIAILATSGRSVSTEFGVPLTIGVILLGAVGLVAVQARYGSRTVVAELDPEPVSDDGPRNVTRRVRRLAIQADVPKPSVAVADSSEPGCLTIGTQRSPTVVVTTGLLERLDDDELDAALAHEVAHVANRDLPVVTAIAASVAIGDRLLERERTLRRSLETTFWIAVLTGIGIILFALPFVLLAVAYLVVSPIARGLLAVNAVALGLFSKTREYAADRGAAQLTGNPSALASALETLEADRPTRDARIHASATLGIVPQPLSVTVESDDETESWFERWFASSLESIRPETRAETRESIEQAGYADRALASVRAWLSAHLIAPVATPIRRALAWRPSTHPPVGARIERLRAIERRRR